MNTASYHTVFSLRKYHNTTQITQSETSQKYHIDFMWQLMLHFSCKEFVEEQWTRTVKMARMVKSFFGFDSKKKDEIPPIGAPTSVTKGAEMKLTPEGDIQVRSLTQLISFCVSQKIFWLSLEAKLMTPHWGGYCSPAFFPATSFPHEPFNSPNVAFKQLQRYKNVVSCEQ